MEQISNWQIILAIIIVGLSIVMPIYYSYQKKKKQQEAEHEKIKAMEKVLISKQEVSIKCWKL